MQTAAAAPPSKEQVKSSTKDAKGSARKPPDSSKASNRTASKTAKKAAEAKSTKPETATKAAAKTSAKPAQKASAQTKSTARATAKPAHAQKPAAAVAPAAPPVARPAPPRRSSAPLAMASSTATSREDVAALERVIEALRGRKPADAMQIKDTIVDPVAQTLAEWLILRSDNNNVTVERYRSFIANNPSWPSQTFLRRRLEAALWDDNRDDATVLHWFASETPLSAKGRLALAKAQLARGDRRSAERLVRQAWRNDPMSRDTESRALEMFSGLLTASDHKARMDFLLFTDDREGAQRAAQRVGATQVAIAKAHIAVDRKAGNAKALLDAVPADAHGDPSYVFARVQHLRRADKIAEAGALMAHAPNEPSRLGNLDEWWIERRLVARKLLDIGDPRTAYIVARNAAVPSRDIYRTEHQFTAGWIALRFLDDPSTALQHFLQIGVDSVNPTALARAGYWQGRAYEALGRTQEMKAAYQSAARQSTSYYGQLARARLGLSQLALNDVPARSRGAERLEIVRAVELLYTIDEPKLAIPILSDMAERADDPSALAALAELASRAGDAKGLLLVGKGALNRGFPFDFYAYPVSGLPSFRPIGPEVERSVIYSIARQESAFDPTVVSPANAYGLMQVTPDAGRYVAKKYGATFDLAKLKNDPVYNTALGSAELAGLLDDYRGSYIMTFAGYNAGRGSVRKWIERYGDPRDPKVDAVDWVELIPFSETRNYVQRIMENLQVYRARFGGGSGLRIEADLRRGAMERKAED